MAYNRIAAAYNANCRRSVYRFEDSGEIVELFLRQH